MEQTPLHDVHNADLLALIPLNARRVVDVGCMSGALAREYKRLNPRAHYTGIDIVSDYADVASAHCDQTLHLDIEGVDLDALLKELPADCWVFGDVLEHLRDPWRVLAGVRKWLPRGGKVVACIPNVQHWSVQAKLSFGDFRYEDSGLFDRTHVRWFTRNTMIELFQGAGLTIEHASARVFDEPQREAFLPIIRTMATAANADPEMAVNDALPLQYLFRCTVA